MAAGCAAAAAPLAAQVKSDWERAQEERDWQEGEVKLPAFPKPADLIEFSVGAASRLRFFIDPVSLSVSGDDVVRFTLVARSPAGAENISFEGIRCRLRTYKLYALGQRDGTWKSVSADWRTTESAWIGVLRRDFFCPTHAAILSSAEGIDALRQGRHPRLR